MKDFILREISLTSDDGKLTVTRNRTSTGTACIRIGVNNKDLFLDNKEDDKYEIRALKLAQMINTIASNPCRLPESKEE